MHPDDKKRLERELALYRATRGPDYSDHEREVAANNAHIQRGQAATAEDFNGVIASGAATMSDMGKSYGDVLSTARKSLKFYDFEEIANISKSSDFSMEDLKLGNTDLFVCAATRRKIIAGALALEHAEKNPGGEFSRTILGLIQRYVTTDRDRALFDLDPLPPEDRKPAHARKSWLQSVGWTK